MCHKVCKPQYSYGGASTTPYDDDDDDDDDAGMPVCCVYQAVLVPVLQYLFHLFSACVLCVLCYSLIWHLSLKTLLLICNFILFH